MSSHGTRMETTMYDDNNKCVKKMKLGMSLDLATAEQQKKKQARLSEMTLATPDLGLFMLTSPDLERFIIQQNGLILTTPTPTTQILFPKSVTEEQEAYARGFVDALGELHKNYGAPVVAPTASSATGVAQPTASTSTVQRQVVVGNGSAGGNRTIVFPSTLTTTTMLPGSVFTQPSAMPQPQSTVRLTGVKQNTVLQYPVKLEPAQTVPTFQTPTSVTASSFSASNSSMLPTSLTPINMDDQEEAKLDRKRARNRLAATRCRNRKLERISRLEERVKELKGQNTSLAETAAALRDQVYRLKQDIIQHTQSGCQVMLTHNLL